MTTTTDPALRRGKLRAFAVVIALLLLIMLAYIARRLSVDVPNVLAGTVPDDEYERRYVEHPWLAYAHIAPGLVYLLGVPLQMAYRFRSRHYDVHRRTGRVLLTAGLFSGAFAIAFGVLYPFGGPVEAAAAVVFGIWFLFCLVSAFRAIKRDDVVAHRRWMIRAFAGRRRGRHDQDLGRPVPGLRPARLRRQLRPGVLDLVLAAHAGRGVVGPQHAAPAGLSRLDPDTVSDGTVVQSCSASETSPRWAGYRSGCCGTTTRSACSAPPGWTRTAATGTTRRSSCAG